MKHVFPAVLFGIICGIISVLGANSFILFGSPWPMLAALTGFFLAWTLTLTSDWNVVPTVYYPHVHNTTVLTGWSLAVGVGMFFVLYPSFTQFSSN